MTPDDEAFVRAVVDRPGDDLPRLVYADWLDERNDPRGAYLRAEAESPGADRLAGLAAGLDPVWVARVSRPPAGVCCDHIQWTGHGGGAPEAKIHEVELEADITFPSDYRAFLRNYNGARLWESRNLPDGRIVEKYDDYGYHFYSLDEFWDSFAYRQTTILRCNFTPAACDWFLRLLPIGHGEEIINVIMLGLTGPERGKVLDFDSQVSLDSNLEWYQTGYSRHAATLPMFLSSLPSDLTRNDP